MTDLRDLLESIRQGARPPLSIDEVELLLGWLTGSAAREVGNGTELPNPAHDPVLLQMVLFRLDDELFEGGELRAAAAGLETSEPTTRRRIRFRRLASAFHPDRFPDLADWLTQRSQAVHRAYALFKQDPEGPAEAVGNARSHVSPHQPGPQRRDMRRPAPRVRKHRIRALANQLRARFGNDRYLAHKLIGGLALLALLPVLNMVLVPVSGPDETLYGSRLTVVEDEPVSGFRFPVSGERQDGAAGDSVQVDGDAGARGDESAQDAPPKTGRTADELTANNANQPTSQLANQRTSAPVEDAGAGYDRAEGAGDSFLGAGSRRDDRALETQIAASQAEAAAIDHPDPQPETGNPKPSPSTSDPEISPLLAAARRVMNPNGDVVPLAALQTVDEQLAAMGLANDTERLYRRIGREEESARDAPPTESRIADQASGEADSAVGAGSSRDDRPGEADSAVGAGSSRDDRPGEADSAVGAGSSRDDRPGEADSAVGAGSSRDDRPGEADSAVGAGSSRDDRAPETRITASSAEGAAIDQPAPKPETGKPKPSPAAPSARDAPPTESRIADQTSGEADSAVGPGSSRDDHPGEADSAVGAGSSRDDRPPETRITASSAEGAAIDQPAPKPETRNPKPSPAAPSARDAPPTESRIADQASGEADSAVGAGSSRDDRPGEADSAVGAGSSRDDRAPETRITASSAEGAAIDQPAPKPETRNPKPSPAAPSARDAPPTESRIADQTSGEADSAVGASSSRDDRPGEADSAVGAGSSRDDRPGEADSAVGAGSSRDDRPGEADSAVGAGSSRDDRAPETRITASSAEGAAIDQPAPKPETGKPKPSPAAPSARDAPPTESRIADQASGEADSAVGAGSSRDDRPGEADSAVGAGSSRDDRAPETRITASSAEGAAIDQPAPKPETGNPKPSPAAPSARDAPPTESRIADQASGEADSAVGAGSSRDDRPGEADSAVGAGSSRDDRAPETRITASSAEGAAIDQPAPKPETGNPKPSPEPRSDSELALGPLATHPAGELLTRLHEALAAGNIPGVAGTFMPDAQMRTLRGRDQIAHHFRVELNPADSRSVNLKVLRLGRGDGGWRIEADLDVRVDRDGETRTLLSGRSNFWLAERGNRLLITRMDSE